MYILLGSLRTGFIQDSRVFQYREPSAVLGILISNTLASLVLNPERIKQLTVLTNGKMDQLFSEKIADYIEVNKDCIVLQENQSLVDWLADSANKTPVIISSLNRTEQQHDYAAEEPVKTEVRTLPEEKVPIEISNNIEQKLLWYEDFHVHSNCNRVSEINGAGTLVFAKEIDFEVHDVPMFEMHVLPQVKIDCPEAGKRLKELLLKINFKFDWPTEFDYLNDDQFTLLKSHLFHDKYESYADSSNTFGNAYVLNGFRAINALYHKMGRNQLKNGLVFIEQQGLWNILHFKKAEVSL